jgi:hypothetical protein
MARISNSVKKSIRQIDAEMVLKCAFLVQADRIEKLIQNEEETGVLAECGYREVLAMKDIGDALRKLEVGEQVTRGGTSRPYAGKRSSKNMEPNVVSTSASAADQRLDLNDNSLLARVSRLDIVDRNLLVAATTRVIDLIELETQTENFEAANPEPETVGLAESHADGAGPLFPTN